VGSAKETCVGGNREDGWSSRAFFIRSLSFLSFSARWTELSVRRNGHGMIEVCFVRRHPRRMDY
jgi:hypothetical protein